ncbi:hypothetical protein AALO_G00156720 [Alosa alosa]|uniref:Uncharacterized protein n=1 Tax=Alosa alosa TaxID=278164 RepID=A0AAV6GGE7_9TELE|nr:hypothetical protein AALO_G00156720 [Alosa alosa]
MVNMDDNLTMDNGSHSLDKKTKNIDVISLSHHLAHNIDGWRQTSAAPSVGEMTKLHVPLPCYFDCLPCNHPSDPGSAAEAVLQWMASFLPTNSHPHRISPIMEPWGSSL